MRVGRDVHDRLKARVLNGLKLAPRERIELIVALHGRKPPADCLVLTNARALLVRAQEDPRDWTRRQVLADEIGSWNLSRKFRSRLTLTSGYRHVSAFGSGLSVYDDDLVDEQLTALVSHREQPATMEAVRALRAQAHWVSTASDRSVYVLDRSVLAGETADVLDLDMVERQLSQFDHWPSSEVHRHVATCLPAGGCFLARAAADSVEQRAAGVDGAHVTAVADALVTIDAMKIKKSPGRESEVISRLMSIVTNIRTMSVWTSPQLDENDVRVNLHDEIRQIALGCHQVAELREEIGDRPEGSSATGSKAAEMHDASVLSLDAVAGRLAERVNALSNYRDRLRTLSQELADLDGAHRIEQIAERIASLAASASGDDELSERVSSLIPRSREPLDAVPAAVDALRDEIEALHGMGDPARDLPRP
jgi:hypothetical protein